MPRATSAIRAVSASRDPQSRSSLNSLAPGSRAKTMMRTPACANQCELEKVGFQCPSLYHPQIPNNSLARLQGRQSPAFARFGVESWGVRRPRFPPNCSPNAHHSPKLGSSPKKSLGFDDSNINALAPAMLRAVLRFARLPNKTTTMPSLPRSGLRQDRTLPIMSCPRMSRLDPAEGLSTGKC